MRHNRREQIEAFFHKKELIHIFYLLYFKPHMNIIEAPTFHTAALEYDDKYIYLRQECFTGLKGVLSFNTTMNIIRSPDKLDILKFLSIFSGRLLQLRAKYTLQLMAHSKGYAGEFIQSLGGYNSIPSIPSQYFTRKNKTLYDLRKVLKIFTKGEVYVHKYDFNIIDHHIPQKKMLGALVLGERMAIRATSIRIYLPNYQSFISIVKQEKTLIYLVEYYTNSYKLSFEIPREKILLGNYLLSGRVSFSVCRKHVSS